MCTADARSVCYSWVFCWCFRRQHDNRLHQLNVQRYSTPKWQPFVHHRGLTSGSGQKCDWLSARCLWLQRLRDRYYCWRQRPVKQRIRGRRRFLWRAVCRQRRAAVESVAAVVLHETVWTLLPPRRSEPTTYWRSGRESSNVINSQTVNQAASLRYRRSNCSLAQCLPDYFLIQSQRPFQRCAVDEDSDMRVVRSRCNTAVSVLLRQPHKTTSQSPSNAPSYVRLCPWSSSHCRRPHSFCLSKYCCKCNFFICNVSYQRRRIRLLLCTVVHTH